MENKISYRDFLTLNWSKNKKNVPTGFLSRMNVKIQDSKHHNNYLIKENRAIPYTTAFGLVNNFKFLKRDINNSYITLPFFADGPARLKSYGGIYVSGINWPMFIDPLFRSFNFNKKSLDGGLIRYQGYIGNGLIFYCRGTYNRDSGKYEYLELTVLAALTTTNDYFDYVKDSAMVNPSVLSLYVKDDFDVAGSGYGTLRTVFRKTIKKECIDLGIDIADTDDLNMFVELKEAETIDTHPHIDINDFSSVSILNTLANEFIKREITPDVVNQRLISIV